MGVGVEVAEEGVFAVAAVEAGALCEHGGDEGDEEKGEGEGM